MDQVTNWDNDGHAVLINHDKTRTYVQLPLLQLYMFKVSAVKKQQRPKIFLWPKRVDVEQRWLLYKHIVAMICVLPGAHHKYFSD